MKTLLPVLFLPLITAVLIRLNATRLKKGAAAWIACGSLVTSFIFAAISFLSLKAMPAEARSVVVPIFEWAKVGIESYRFDLLLDPLSAVMICVVTGVGSLIHIYSSSYMHEE